MKKVQIILTGSGGELDRADITPPAGHPDPEEFINIAASAAVEGWMLSVGDTITIVEG